MTRRISANGLLQRIGNMLQCGVQRQSASMLHKVGVQKPCSSAAHRINPVGIQMIPEKLRKKLFPTRAPDPEINSKRLSAVRKHLEAHNLLNVAKVPVVEAPNIELPELFGTSITEHFDTIAADYTEPYLSALSKLTAAEVPPIPGEFALQHGWVRYSKDGKKSKAVPAPKGDAVVFDVETMVTEGGLPAMAVALTATHWYSWCSAALAEGRNHRVDEERVSPDLLIPMACGSKQHHRVIVGHNVAFDRGYIREQYLLEKCNTRFLDTLSMHVCVSGQTSEQKIMTMSVKKKKAAFEERLKTNQRSELNAKPTMHIRWMSVSSLNNLADVYRLYCGDTLEKSARDTFVKGSSDDVRKDFQYLMRYCASDVLATRNVLAKLLPLFLERFPHRATLFGMLETLSAYLPVNENWEKFLTRCNAVYNEHDSKIQHRLNELAKTTCQLMQETEAYRSDPWLWDLDWSTADVKSRKAASQTHPKWFKDLTDKNSTDTAPLAGWDAGSWNTSLQRRSIPKLLKIMWQGYPVHYHSELGWGYLVPCSVERPAHDGKHQQEPRTVLLKDDKKAQTAKFPLDAYLAVIDKNNHRRTSPNGVNVLDDQKQTIQQKLDDLGDFSKLDNDWKEVAHESSKVFLTESEVLKRKTSTAASASAAAAASVSYDIGLNGVLFKKLPQRPGSTFNVGSPLSRFMIEKYWGTTLTSWDHDAVVDLLALTRTTSYWKKVRDKIADQMVVWLSADQGAILPRIMPAGTIYRRPVDRTWSTTMQPSKHRIGSEFKAMVQAPNGYHFVGFQSDQSQLWLAALLGDADFGQMHGSTAFGWRVLQGPLLPQLSVHRLTASVVGCSEQEAKILDYVRLHGGGKSVLCRILMDFRPTLGVAEAAELTTTLLRLTKGERQWPQSQDKAQLNELPVGRFRRSVLFSDGSRLTQTKRWQNGSESYAFNRIEQIASDSLPSLPLLNGRVSRALEPRFVFNNYALSRANWVVQSSAVDVQHLTLLSVRQLFDAFDVKAHFTMTMHDGMRFMVDSKQRYKAALALHISNLYVTSFCAASVGLDDLPFSVAFYPFVTVDKVLRRDAADDCVTPSNPNGLHRTYNVAQGEALDIHQTLQMLKKHSP